MDSTQTTTTNGDMPDVTIRTAHLAQIVVNLDLQLIVTHEQPEDMRYRPNWKPEAVLVEAYDSDGNHLGTLARLSKVVGWEQLLPTFIEQARLAFPLNAVWRLYYTDEVVS
jgi:hypothetical protein